MLLNSPSNKNLTRNFAALSPSSPTASSFRYLTSQVKSPAESKKKKYAAIAIGSILLASSIGLATYFLLRDPGNAAFQEIAIELSVGNDPVELNPGNLYRVPYSQSNQIYTLYLMNKDANVMVDTPAARSYDGNQWEPIFPVLKEVFDCNSGKCVLRIAKDEGKFVIVPSNVTTFKDEELVADFLIQTTFGPTKESMLKFPKGLDFKQRAKEFILEQMQIPSTLHREYYREHANQLTTNRGLRSGNPRGPCEVGSRWERSALDYNDFRSNFTVVNRSLLFINGEFRTEVSNAFASSIPSPNSTYYFCRSFITQVGAIQDFSPSYPVDTFDCLRASRLTIPPVNFTSRFPDNARIIHNNAIFTKLDVDVDNVFLLNSVSGSCNVTSSSRNLYARDSLGVWYRYQPRIRLLKNTVESPQLRNFAAVQSWDSNAAKDFVNEDYCKVVFNGISSYVDRCGSPGEVENIPRKGNQYYFSNLGIRNSEYFDRGQVTFRIDFNNVITKRSVWLNIALFKQDQLRQRVAWALSQIFVVTTFNIGRDNFNDIWLKYYDIFVRNAFGNYFDVMKEVSYSPMMGAMLSYIGSKAFQNTRVKPDENYAREIMQLFSIGLWKLNRNGTQITDSNGNTLETYTTLDIQNFARVWTGFKARPARGNLEVGENFIDPMSISASEHDSFPKNGLDGTHIGDTYPLCSQLPSKIFLKRGAKFRFLELVNSPVMNARRSLFPLNRFSFLHRELCNPNSNGDCELKSIVKLARDLECFGVECEIDMIRTVELSLNATQKVYYEFVRPPCVELEFPESSITTLTNTKGNAVCVDAKSVRASPMCCSRSGNSNIATMATKFDGETSTYDYAKNQCQRLNRTLCNSDFTAPSGNFNARVWTSFACNVQAQIFEDGQVSLTHSFNYSQRVSDLPELREDYGIRFRVNWLNNLFPKASSNCDGICTKKGESCVCPTKVLNNPVFVDLDTLPDKFRILDELRIGASDPELFEKGSYSIALKNETSGVTVFVDSSGKLNSRSIFRVVFSGSETVYLANIRSEVYIGDSYRFRNPPNFMQHEERNRRDAEHEVDAVLKHLLYHQNTAPFVADFFIKRFVSSNPSPAYIEAVATAFIFGKYEDIGSGRYGDLAATISATLLYRDALNPSLKSDTSHGKLREPLLKVVHLMRSMEIVSQFNREVDLNRYEGVLGQNPYASPTVFNYYLSKFQPNSAVKRSELFSPESQLLTTPRVTLFLNAMISMIEFGLTRCYGSMGLNIRTVNCANLKNRRTNPNLVNSGYFNYNSSTFNALSGNELVQYFSTMLTGGRLDQSKKEIFAREFQRINSSFSRIDAIKVVLELIISSAEYQVSTTAKSRNSARILSSDANSNTIGALSSENGYKAIVYVYLSGGMDSYNLLVPHSECGNFDLHQNYQDIRTTAALQKQELLSIDVPTWNTPQPCKKFGIIGKMPFLRELYNSSEAAFISNIGALVEPLTRSTYLNRATKKPIALFAHEMQTQHAETIQADAFSSNGILGRIRDQFTMKQLKTSSYSVSGGYSLALEESPGVSEGQFIIDPNSGVNLLDAFNISRGNLRRDVLNLTSSVTESIMSDTWNDILNSGLKRASLLAEVLNTANVTTDFKSAQNSQFNQMEYISRTIASRSKLNSAVDVFDFRMGGFDTHNSFTTFGNNMAVLDSALRAFVTEMKRQKVWDNVVVVVASEFARTLRSNGLGTDHGWGGNTFMLGGSVRGGQILGKFPSSLNDTDLHIGNGILIPTTPWEGMWNGIAQWAGVEDNALDKVLPNRKNFLNGEYLFNKNHLFKK